MLSEMQNYQRFESKDLRVLASQVEGGVERQLVVIQTPFGYRRMAEVIRPEKEGSYPAILYVHWYEPEAHDSNRSQFIEEAKEMARRGTVCLLIETLWSDLDFFLKRTQDDDMQNSMEEVVNIRRAMDFLLSQSSILTGCCLTVWTCSHNTILAQVFRHSRFMRITHDERYMVFAKSLDKILFLYTEDTDGTVFFVK